jgi:coenzyme F420-0:L-glutamate ligase / coenzyme F420-1:gamma-L-glutamate ligase
MAPRRGANRRRSGCAGAGLSHRQSNVMNSDRKLSTAIDERQSIRRFRPQRVARTVVKRLLAAATRAPSAHNRQPWRFAVLDDEAAKQRLANAMGERLRADRTADGDDTNAINADIRRSYARITEAPLVIVVCVDVRVMDRYPDDRRNEAEYLMAVQSTAMAAQNLLLAAHSEGLGACIMCAPLFCPDTVRDALDLPQEWQAQMLLTIGAAADDGKDRPRRDAEEIVIWVSDEALGRAGP